MKKLIIVLALTFCATGAFAAELILGDHTLDLYTSIRANVMYQGVYGRDGHEDTNELQLNFQGNSRIGGYWEHGNALALVELGLNEANVTTRYIYAGYKFAGGQNGIIKFGKLPSISNTDAYYNQRLYNDNGLWAYGTAGEVQVPGVYYGINGFEIQLDKLDNSVFAGMLAGANPTLPTTPATRGIEMFPRIEVAYTLPMFPLKVFGSFAYFSAESVGMNPFTGAAISGTKTYSATAWHAGAIINPTIDQLYFTLGGFYAVNANMYGMVIAGEPWLGAGNTLLPEFKNDKGDLNDVTTYGVTGSVGYNINDRMSCELGAGYQVATSKPYAADDNKMAIYANLAYSPVLHITIIPEIDYFDDMKGTQKDDQGSVLAVGMQVRLDI